MAVSPNDPDFWWDAGDHRFINAFYDADRNQMFTAHTVFRNLQPDSLTGGYPEAAIRWYEIDPAAILKNSVVARKGVVGAPEVDVGWPTVATDSTGTLFVTYSRASAPHGRVPLGLGRHDPAGFDHRDATPRARGVVDLQRPPRARALG